MFWVVNASFLWNFGDRDKGGKSGELEKGSYSIGNEEINFYELSFTVDFNRLSLVTIS